LRLTHGLEGVRAGLVLAEEVNVEHGGVVERCVG
jgi:hypothetical protein